MAHESFRSRDEVFKILAFFLATAIFTAMACIGIETGIGDGVLAGGKGRMDGYEVFLKTSRCLIHHILMGETSMDGGFFFLSGA